MRTYSIKYSFLLLLFLFPFSLFAADGDGGRDFENIANHIVRGDAVLIGNTVLCPQNVDGSCQDDGTINNANADLKVITNSSADLNISISNHQITWAGLFWMGVAQEATTEATAITNFDATLAKTITITTPDDVNHTAPWTTTSKLDTYTKLNGRWFLSYQAYTDITSIVSNAGTGTYKINNLYTTTGATNNPDGNFGAWMIAVIYNDQDISSSTNLRYVSVFNGFKAILDGAGVPDTDFSISGFYTPKEGDVYATMSIFTAEGDKRFGGESLQIHPHNDPVSTNYTPIIYPGGDLTNVFVSGISLPSGYPGTLSRSPSLQYNYAIDLHSMEIGDNADNPRAAQKLITNAETGLDIKINTVNDSFYASTVIMSTEIYEPKFCYDYAYSQYGKYFTAKHNQTAGPYITGTIVSGEPVAVKLYIRNEENSDVTADNLTVNILDINITQAKYQSNSTLVTLPNSIIQTSISDAVLTISADKSSVENIPIGEVDGLEYFYTYYTLDTFTSDINMPINARVDYNVTLPTGATTTTVPYTRYLNSNIEICSGSSVYSPEERIFNIVHNGYANNSLTSGYYYNLPTQVTSRAGNFKVISLDVNNTNTLKDINTTVAVELIDASAFHDTEASCQEESSSISDKVWVTIQGNRASFSAKDIIDNHLLIDPNSAANFYAKARENVAFRISYPVGDSNETTISQEDPIGSGLFKLKDFPGYAGSSCVNDVYFEYLNPAGQLKSKTFTQVPEACANAGTAAASSMSKRELNACLECIYGTKIKYICSRDNFAIRPEAFMMHIDDQNQTNPTSQSRLTTTYSGVSGATAPVLNLASDYTYNIEVNATNHVNNNASDGYIQFFNSADDGSAYTWEPRTGVTVGACNDEDNKTVSISFMNGVVDANTSVNQVGEYRLNIRDTSWTAVDSNSAFMTHHANSFFHPGDGSISLDCIANSSITQDENSSALNGCNISSSHTNNEANSGSSLTYNDYNVTFHPYKFNISSEITMGLTNRDINTTDDFSNFVYMASINNANDINMSVQVNSIITPQGYNDSSLTNFVTGCFAKPLDINISKSTPENTNLNYRYIINDRNTTGSVSGFIPNVTDEDANITTPNTFFAKAMNGVLDSIMNLNFDRNQSVVANPEDINYSKVTVYDPRTFINADLLTNKTAESNISLNGLNGQNITHYFGRTAARKTRIVCNGYPCLSGANGEPDVLIYYETYCYGDTNGKSCERTLLPQLGGRYIQKVDSRWYVNLNHVESGDGNLTATTEQAASVTVTVPTIRTMTNGYTKDSVHNYNGNKGLPHEATMQSTVPNWLVYDENDPVATMNKHTVIFQSETKWTGQHETNTTTQTEKVRRVNRRTMW